MFSKAWHMLGSPSLLVISIPSLANFAFLYALPTCTKMLPTFPMKPLHEESCQSHLSPRRVTDAVGQVNTSLTFVRMGTPATSCDSDPDVWSILTAS